MFVVPIIADEIPEHDERFRLILSNPRGEDGTDYVTPYTGAAGSVVMAATATTAAVDIEICDDGDIEGSENLIIELTNVDGRQTTAVGTIVDDDSVAGVAPTPTP